MTAIPDWVSELPPLLERLIDGQFTSEDGDRLNTLLAQGDAPRRCYRAYMKLHAAMEWRIGERNGAEGLGQWRPSITDQLPSAPLPSPSTIPLPPTFQILDTTTIPGTAGFFSSGWPAAYLIATVVCGIGALIGAFTYVPVHEQVVDTAPSIASERHLTPLPKVESVGRITGTVDCILEEGTGDRGQGAGAENPKSKLRNPKSLVALGDTFSLRSGLLEITYNTGARVVLKGPVTYVVELKNGGFMSVGKLTGKVTTASAKGFSVRTPTAIVTDLGTEFGVEVGRHGGCEVHVLTGMVQTRLLAGPGREPQQVLLRAGEGRRYRPESGVAEIIPVDRAKFDGMLVADNDERRQRWLTYSRQLRTDPSLLAYYAFESRGKDSWILENVAATGEALHGEIIGPRWTTGRFPGKAALYFRGLGSGDKVVLPEQDRFSFAGPFSVAVWFRVARFVAVHQVLVAKGDDAWRVQQSSERDELVFATNYGETKGHGTLGQTEVTDDRWHLVVAVYEPMGDKARKRLHLDGRVDADSWTPLPLHHNTTPVWIGNVCRIPDIPNREFKGLIDEVAIFTRALSAKEVQDMFDAGNPAGPIQGESHLGQLNTHASVRP
jgi:hypothetical protein